MTYGSCFHFCPSLTKQVSTVRDWAEQTGGGGGAKDGRELPRPMQVEVVEENIWNVGGMVPISQRENNDGTAAGTLRLNLPPLTVGKQGERGEGMVGNVYKYG